jgi:Flp pilus assembly protein TadD
MLPAVDRIYTIAECHGVTRGTVRRNPVQVFRIETMSLFRTPSNRGAVTAILFCITACAAAQMPAKDVPVPASTRDSEKTPSDVVAIESDLRRESKLHPDSAPILYKLGQVLRQENKPKESLETYTQAAHLEKPNAEQLRSVALDYVLLDDYDDAIHWLQLASSFDPKNADVLYSLGRCFYSQSRYPEAEQTFLRVLEIKPEHLKAEENLGLIYDFANQPEKAEAALRTAVTWAGDESTDEWPFLDLGAFLLDHDRAAEAAPFLRRASAIATKCTACHEKLGRALVATGDVSAGVKELETAALLDPKNPKMHFQLGLAYRAAGNLEKSRAEFALSQSLYGEHSQE